MHSVTYVTESRFHKAQCPPAASRRPGLSIIRPGTRRRYLLLNGDTTHRAYRISTQSPGHLLALGSPSPETRTARGIRGPDSSLVRLASEPASQTSSCLSPEGPGSSAHRQWQFGNKLASLPCRYR